MLFSVSEGRGTAEGRRTDRRRRGERREKRGRQEVVTAQEKIVWLLVPTRNAFGGSDSRHTRSSNAKREDGRTDRFAMHELKRTADGDQAGRM